MSENRPILAYQGKISDSGENQEYWLAMERSYFSGRCPFCAQPCRLLTNEWVYDSSEQHDTLAACLACGWWSFAANQPSDLSGGCYYYSSRAILREFAVQDQDVPYGELGRYLALHQDRMIDVNPAKFEELVAGVYQDVLGCPVEFCSYGRPDRGIDVLCGRAGTGETFGIQVKRYKSPIKLGQIHQFLGALQLNRLRSGVFVTTSQFQTGCYETVQQSRDLVGVEIDLVDGRRFLEFLNLMNQPEQYLFCADWGRVGYMHNYGLENRIPVAELENAPLSRI